MKKFILSLSLLLSFSAFSLEVTGDRIRDERGNSIEKKQYKKIIVIDPAVVESFFLIGGESSITAIGDTARTPIWPEEKTKDIPKAGAMLKPSLEHVLSFQPDLVIINEVSSSFGENLKSHNIEYLVNESKSFEAILNNLKIYGILTGKENEAGKVAQEYQSKILELKEKISEKPLNIKGAFLYSTSPMMVFSSNSLPGEIFATLGIENIADGLPGGRPILSPEFLISQNPDLLVGSMGISSPQDILNSNPFVKDTKAGKNRNIHILDSRKILRATPRIIDALEDLYGELSNAK
ncbi:MAG: ABC transporter substrate-binding protein [Fusobacteriaceae bacterium]